RSALPLLIKVLSFYGCGRIDSGGRALCPNTHGVSIPLWGQGIRVAYARDGTDRGGADYPDWLAALDWVFGRYQEIRFSFSCYINLGSRRRSIWRPSLYLRNAGFFAHRTADRGPIEHRNGSVSDGARAALDSATARVFDRNASGNSKCDPRAVGYFRNGSVVARLSFPMAQTSVRLDAVLQRPDLRDEHARRRNYYRSHDCADHHFGLARDFAECTGFATGSRLRSRRDALGGDAHRGPKLCQERVVRRSDSRLGTRSGRNNGGHDGHREDTP